MPQIPIYLMPGMAANHLIFQYLKLSDNYQPYYMHWLMPEKDESLKHYVERLRRQIHHENPVLLGVSFGGIIVQELARQIPVSQLILISTVKHHHEFSPFLKKVLKFHLYRLFPSKFLHQSNWFETFSSFHPKFKTRIKLYQKYMDLTHPLYIDWSMRQVLQWQQNQNLDHYLHIVGEKDHIFPEKYIKSPKIVIPEGRHDMIIFKAKQISRIINEKLIY